MTLGAEHPHAKYGATTSQITMVYQLYNGQLISLTLIHDEKLPLSFNSARWKKGYDPEPIFASSSIDNMFVKSVLNHMTHTQPSPICVTINDLA